MCCVNNRHRYSTDVLSRNLLDLKNKVHALESIHLLTVVRSVLLYIVLVVRTLTLRSSRPLARGTLALVATTDHNKCG